MFVQFPRKLRCEEVTWWGDGAIVWVAKINVVGGVHDCYVRPLHRYIDFTMFTVDRCARLRTMCS